MSAFARLTQAPVVPTCDDELYNMDVEAALFSSASASDGDAFSPAAFKNLQATAAGLLTQMQTAYRSKANAVKELEDEKSAQRDELDEAVTRARHLKMQLEEMARKAQEQEKDMKRLIEEVTAERKARADLDVSRAKRRIAPPSEISTVSEDLSVDEELRRKKWRSSRGTIRSDGSFDTDEESAESESVFSRPRSPTTTIPSNNNSATEGSGPDGPQQRPSRRSLNVVPPRARGEPPQMSALQRIFKGISGDAEGGGPESCRNCKGKDASVAWDTVSLLRDENKHLKQRVGQLEVAVDTALDVVNGVGL